VTSSLGARLQAVHERLDGEPMPEWLEGASCGPAAKHLAHLAIHIAAAGGSQADWQAWIGTHVGEVPVNVLTDATECMRTAGMWPWPKPREGPD
jgi:hypothetical protein